MAVPALAGDFREFLKSLNSNNVEYLLIGGYAVGIYGHIRATNDLDIWVNISPENAAKIVWLVYAKTRGSGRAKDLAELESLPS